MKTVNKAKEITEALYTKDHDLYERLQRAGGYRGLFDSLSAEWHSSGAAEKIALIKEIERTGLARTVDLVDACVDVMVGQGHLREVALRDCFDGLCHLFSYEIQGS